MRSENTYRPLSDSRASGGLIHHQKMWLHHEGVIEWETSFCEIFLDCGGRLSSMLLQSKLLLHESIFATSNCKRNFRYYALKVRMTPWSIGWVIDVVFAGRNISSTFDNFMCGWHAALSKKRTTFLLCSVIFELNDFNHSSMRHAVIQAFLFQQQRTGREVRLRLRKQRGFSDFPMTSSLRL